VRYLCMKGVHLRLRLSTVCVPMNLDCQERQSTETKDLDSHANQESKIKFSSFVKRFRETALRVRGAKKSKVSLRVPAAGVRNRLDGHVSPLASTIR
jgi:hypothetical protein